MVPGSPERSAAERAARLGRAQRLRGGRKGGGAVLTPFGEELLARFREMEKTVRTSLAADLAWLQNNRNLQQNGRG